jgi:hypothetical protein
MIILVGIQTKLNDIVSKFKMLNVLGEDLTWTEKMEKIGKINEERKKDNDEAWGKVQAVEQLRESFNNAAQAAERNRLQSNVAQTAHTNMTAIGSGAVAGINGGDVGQARRLFDRRTTNITDLVGERRDTDFNILINDTTRSYNNNPNKNFIEYFKEEMDHSYGGDPRYIRDINDAIITKTGQVIRTAPDDNVYAFKSLGGAKSAQEAHPAEVNIRFGDVNIIVPEGSSPTHAEAIGRSAAHGFSALIAQELSYKLLRESL